MRINIKYYSPNVTLRCRPQLQAAVDMDGRYSSSRRPKLVLVHEVAKDMPRAVEDRTQELYATGFMN